MTRNKMTDLNDHLFAQLERLSDEELSAEALEAEIKRAKAVSGIAQQVIANADLGLRAAEDARGGRLAAGERAPARAGRDAKASLASWMHDRGVKPTSKHQRRCRACIDAGRERL